MGKDKSKTRTMEDSQKHIKNSGREYTGEKRRLQKNNGQLV